MFQQPGCLGIATAAALAWWLLGPFPRDAAALALPRPSSLAPHRISGAPARFTFAPYLQDVREESLVIAWATDVVTSGVVQVFEPAAADNTAEGPAPQGQGWTLRFVSTSPAGIYHRVKLTGLAAGKRYGYVVLARRSADQPWTETATPLSEFNTASARGPFVFLVYGDTRDRDGDHAAVVQAMLAEHADLVLQTGDMVSRASDEGQWRRYFSTAAPLLRSAPLYPTIGNHELRGDLAAAHFRRLFVLPGGPFSPPFHRRRPIYYAFRYSNSMFVALDGNSPYDLEQTAWLERTLRGSQADSSIRHVFVFVHQPPYAVGTYCGSERLARRVVPILQRYSVRAVFAGHEHAYQHLERSGLRFFISGGGGAPLYVRSRACSREDDMSLRLFRAEHHYLRVQIEGDAATLLAIDRKGGLMERVVLHEPVRATPPAPRSQLALGLAAPPPTDIIEGAEEPQSSHQLGLPLLAMSKQAETLTAVEPPAPPPSIGPLHAGMVQGSGPLLLLWLSSVSLIAGLFLLSRDLSPRARRD